MSQVNHEFSGNDNKNAFKFDSSFLKFQVDIISFYLR